MGSGRRDALAAPRHPEVRAKRASKDERLHRWPSPFEMHFALLRVTDYIGSGLSHHAPGRGVHYSGATRTAPLAALVVSAAWALSAIVTLRLRFWAGLPGLRPARQHGLAALGQRGIIDNAADRARWRSITAKMWLTVPIRLFLSFSSPRFVRVSNSRLPQMRTLRSPY